MSTADEIAAFEKSVQDRGLRIADVLRQAEIDRSMWTRWKNGTTVPRLDNWRAMERAADIDGSGTVNSVVAGDGIIVDNTDPTAPVVSVDPSINPILLGYLAGLTLANNATDANNDVDFASGTATSSDGAAVIELASALTKRLDAAWAVGTNNGGLFSGSKANSTWYHCFAILRPDTGVVDAGFDTSPIAANRPAAYTKFRRLGAVLTDGSGNIRAFVQYGNHFIWSEPQQTESTTVSSTAQLVGITVPTGVVVKARVHCWATQASATTLTYISDPASADLAPSSTVAPGYTLINVASGSDKQLKELFTNTSGQVRARSNQSSTTVRFNVFSWEELL